jgi:AraC family transcriptional regulator
VNFPTADVHRSSRLGHGAFYGDYREQRHVGHLALAEMRPTVPEHDVHTHTHDDAHFLLLLDGHT